MTAEKARVATGNKVVDLTRYIMARDGLTQDLAYALANGEKLTVFDCTYGGHRLEDFTPKGCKTSGCDVGVGGDLLLEEANRVISEEYPEIAARTNVCMPDEMMRRVGQSVAAASLPEIR